MSMLKGKTVLVTGGTSGIGEASVMALAQAGANVVLTGRRMPEGEKVAEKARRHGTKVLFVQGDVSREADARRAVEEAVKLGGGKLDGAFNNAGVEGAIGVPLHEQTEANYAQIMDINVKGVLWSMKHEIAAMLKSGGGSIVNNASVAGSIGFPGASVYVASKHAVIGLSRTAALEYGKQGVRVNIVSPAAIQTDMIDRFTGGKGSEMHTAIAGMHPIGRIGTPDEITGAVLFLLSPASSFVTGLDLRVDGGFTAQ